MLCAFFLKSNFFSVYFRSVQDANETFYSIHDELSAYQPNGIHTKLKIFLVYLAV